MFVGVSTALTAVRRVFHPFVREGLKLYYRFTGTFNETTPDFLLDGSTSFDGSNDYIDLDAHIGDFSSQTTGTISLWFKTSSDSSSMSFISASDWGDASSNFSILCNVKKIQLNIRENGTYTIDAVGSVDYNDNKWHHLAFAVDGSGNKMYIDGSQISLTYSTGSASTQSWFNSINDLDTLSIGANKDNTTRVENYFNGSMANVGIWDRALSASEVESIQWRGSYSELKDTELTNLVSWYDLSSTELVGSNLITNGDMEADSSWSTSSSASTNERSTEQVYAGTYSRKFVPTSTSDGIQSATITTEISTYTVSFWAYLTNGTELYYAVRRGDAGGWATEVDATGLTTNAWNYLTTTYTDTTGGSSGYMRITSGPTTSGNFYIDEVSLKKVQTSDSAGSNNGTIVGATTNTDSYSGESPFKPRIQDKATPKMAVQLADGSTSFDGTNDYIDLPTSSAPTGNEITISFWEKTSSVHANKLIEGLDSSGDKQLNIHLHYSNGQTYWDAGHDGSSYDRINTSNPSGVLGQWNHWAYTKNASTGRMEVYLNGSLFMGGNSKTKPIGSLSGGSLRVGGDTSFFYDGSLANFAFFSSALTQIQIQELMFTERYQNLSADLKTNLVSWYDLGSVELGTSLITGDSSNMDTVGSWTAGSWASAVNGSVTSVSGGQTGNAIKVDTDSGRAFAKYNHTSGLTVVNGRSYRFSVWGKNGEGEGIVALAYTFGYSHYVNDATATTVDGKVSTYDFQSQDTDLHIALVQASSGNSVLWDNVTVKPINVADSHGSNTGEVYGATTTTGYTSSPHGVVDPLNFGEVYSGRALDFDGTNDYVDCGDGTSLDITSNLSMSFWVKFDSGSATQFLIGRDDDVNRNFELGIGSNKLFWNIYSGGVAKGGSGLGSTLSDNIWYHISATYDGSNLKTYVNGSLNSTNSGTGAIDNDNVSFTIGAREGGMDRHFNGKMSSVKVFNISLTQDQVRELYTKPETVLPTGVSASNLKLDLPMQEGANSYVYDGSGNQNHGTITGATWVTGQEYGYQASLVRSNTPMHFDNSNDLVQISSNLSSNWTFSTWAQADFTDSNWHELYDKNPSGGGGRITIAIVNNKFQMYDTAYRDSGWTLSDKNWHHYVITQTGTALKFYVDGSYQATVTGNGNSLGGDAHIGRYYPLAIEYWSGIINEVALYDTALDADAVSALYGSGTPLLPTSDSGNYDNSDSLVGYWRNDGITTWTDRANTGVASFDNTDDYIVKTSATGIPTDYPITLSAWFKTGASTTGISDAIFGVYNPSSANNWLAIGIEDGGIRAWIRTNSGTNANAQGSGYDDGNWHHAVVVYTSDTDRKVYVDGSLISTITDGIGATTYPSSLSVISVGRHGDATPGEYFNGQIAGCNIFNVALSATEVSELYAIDKRSSISGHSQFSNCVASYLMGAGDGDSTSTIQDQTSNNNDLTVNGASLVGYNDGTALYATQSVVIPEGSTSGRDSQGFYLSDTTSVSNGARFFQNEYILVDSSEALAKIFDGGGSVEGWIKPQSDGGGNAGRIINKDDGSGWFLFVENESSSSVRLQFNIRFSTTEGAWQMNNNSIPINQWSHFALTYDGSSTSNNPIIYINSSSEALTEVSTPVGSLKDDTSEDIYIGTEDGSPANGFEGLIDEIRIYDKILSASEVTKNYNNGKSSHQ